VVFARKAGKFCCETGTLFVSAYGKSGGRWRGDANRGPAGARDQSLLLPTFFYASLFLFGLGVGLLMVFRCASVYGLMLSAEL